MPCTAIGGVAKGWGNWIGIRHWVSDNKRYPSLSWPFSSFVAGWNLFGHSLYSSEPGEDRRTGAARPPGLVQSGGLVCGPVESQCLCSRCAVRMCEPRIPQSPGVICVIITIITLRLQEISTMASEEKPCLCSMTTTDHAYKEQWTRCLDTY